MLPRVPAYARASWNVRQLGLCTVHNASLVARRPESEKGDDGYVLDMLAQRIGELEDLRRASAVRDPTSLEAYIASRLSTGPAAADPLGAIPLDLVVMAAEVTGRLETLSPTAPTRRRVSGFDQAVGSAGDDILAGGEPAVRDWRSADESNAVEVSELDGLLAAIEARSHPYRGEKGFIRLTRCEAEVQLDKVWAVLAGDLDVRVEIGPGRLTFERVWVRGQKGCKVATDGAPEGFISETHFVSMTNVSIPMVRALIAGGYLEGEFFNGRDGKLRLALPGDAAEEFAARHVSLRELRELDLPDRIEIRKRLEAAGVPVLLEGVRLATRLYRVAVLPQDLATAVPCLTRKAATGREFRCAFCAVWPVTSVPTRPA